MAQLVKNPPAMWETCVQSLGREDPLEKEMATHSSTPAWKIPWTEAKVHGVAKSQTRLSDFTFFLSIVSFGEGNETHWRIPWMEGPGGLQSMGLHRVGHD